MSSSSILPSLSLAQSAGWSNEAPEHRSWNNTLRSAYPWGHLPVSSHTDPNESTSAYNLRLGKLSFLQLSEVIFPTREGRDCNLILCQLVYLKFLLTSFLQFLRTTTLRCCSPCMRTSPEILWINSCAVHHIALMTIYQLDKIHHTSSEQTKL